MSAFDNATLMITGGTGSFGSTVLKHFLDSDLKEIRIFSRDEKKQDDMRHELRFPMLSGAYQIIALLAHMEQHLDSSGIGLRQVCDWAVTAHALRNCFDGETLAFAFESLIGIVQNLILFMPFGFLLCGATDQPRTSRILLLGFLLSLSIELCQLFFRLGWFEVDDILHNVLGTYLGICLYRRAVKRTST